MNRHAGFWLLALCMSVGVAAQDAPNAQRGRTLATTCLGCHGIPNYNNAFPNYRVPKLEGQHADYIMSALQAYRNGDRAHITMHAQAASLSDQDMREVAIYFAGQPLRTDAKAVGTAPQSAQVCVACHGQNGVGITPLYPSLSGQHADYLERSLTDYKKGVRKNAIMKTFAGQLSAQQIKELSQYYAKQSPALRTAKRPDSRFSMGKD
jgi:cytochrome c553